MTLPRLILLLGSKGGKIAMVVLEKGTVSLFRDIDPLSMIMKFSSCDPVTLEETKVAEYNNQIIIFN